MSIDNIGGDQVSVIKDSSVGGDVKELLKSKLSNANVRDEKSGKLFGQYHLPDYRNRVQEVGIVDTNELKEKVPEVYEELVETTVENFTSPKPLDIVAEVARDMQENPEYYSGEYKQEILNKSFAVLALEAREADNLCYGWSETIFHTRKIMDMSQKENEEAIDYVFRAFSAEEDANVNKSHINKVPELVRFMVNDIEDPIFDKAKDYIESRKKVYQEGDNLRQRHVQYAEFSEKALESVRNDVTNRASLEK
jgi:protein-tyrosine-phosphatase